MSTLPDPNQPLQPSQKLQFISCRAETYNCAIPRSGEEVTISYIDETMPLADRQEALRDYGFTCACAKCVAEGK